MKDANASIVPWMLRRQRLLDSMIWIVVALIIITVSDSTSQVKFKIPIVYTDSIFTGGQDPTDTTGLTFSSLRIDTLWFGYHDQGTVCRDTLTGFTTHWTLADTGATVEDLLPFAPPSGVELKFVPYDNVVQACFADGSKADIRHYSAPTQRDSLRFRTACDNDPILFHREILQWPSVLSQYFDSCRIRNVGGAAVNIEMTHEFKATSLLFNASQLAAHNFRIVPSGPKVPPPPVATVTLLTPADGAINQPLSLTITWQAAAGALSYSVQTARDALFSNLIVDQTVGGGTTSKALTGLVQGASYYWRVAVFTNGGASYYQNPPNSFTCQGTSDVKDGVGSTASRFALDQNYPNPFNPTTVIRYALPIREHVRISVFDVLGREVATLVNEVQSAGLKSVEFKPARELASGIYTYRLTAGTFTETKKMSLIR